MMYITDNEKSYQYVKKPSKLISVMRFKRFYPDPTIADLVDFFWIFEWKPANGETLVHPTLATVYPKIAFQYKGSITLSYESNSSTAFRSGLQAPMNSFYKMSISEECGVFGLFLKPYAIPCLFGHSAQSLVNQNIEISDLLGVDGRLLEERIAVALSDEERIQVATTFIQRFAQKRKPKRIFHAVTQIIRQKGLSNVNEIASETFISQRHFERTFKEYTGLSPKTFSRIIRLDFLLNSAVNTRRSLIDLAIEYGYYDQSHLIKDCKQFVGASPGEYLDDETIRGWD